MLVGGFHQTRHVERHGGFLCLDGFQAKAALNLRAEFAIFTVNFEGRIMTVTWIVLCNASRARICEWVDGQRKLREVVDLVHPQSQMKGVELEADRPGHVHRSMGDGTVGRTALDPRTDPRQKEHEVFARELSRYVDEALKARRCGALVLVASNPFLGELKSHLSPACEKAVQATLPSDLTGFDLHEIEQRLAALMVKGS